MTVWWKDLGTGLVMARVDLATARREAIECLLRQHHNVRVSREPMLTGTEVGGLTALDPPDWTC